MRVPLSSWTFGTSKAVETQNAKAQMCVYGEVRPYDDKLQTGS